MDTIIIAVCSLLAGMALEYKFHFYADFLEYHAEKIARKAKIKITIKHF